MPPPFTPQLTAVVVASYSQCLNVPVNGLQSLDAPLIGQGLSLREVGDVDKGVIDLLEGGVRDPVGGDGCFAECLLSGAMRTATYSPDAGPGSPRRARQKVDSGQRRS